MKYKNPNCKKIKSSYLMMVSCGYCKTEIASYQKLGRGGLLRMYLDRIIETSVDLYVEDRGLRCPNCDKLIASRSLDKKRDTIVYNMIRSSYNTKIL